MRKLKLSRAAPFVGLVALALSVSASAASHWTVRAPVPSTGSGVEGMFVGATSSSTIVAAYGLDSGLGDTNATRIYHVTTNTWTTGSAAPAPPRSEGSAVVFKGKLYTVGGRAGGVLPDLDRYDPLTDTWAVLAPMPTARAGLATATVRGSIYAIGGRLAPGGPCSGPGQEVATVERYNIATGVWSVEASLPSARSDAAAMVANGKIYVFGGCANGAILGDVDVYDPASNTWSTAPADLPTPGAAFYTLGHKGKQNIYVIGGYDGTGTPLNTVQIYNASTDSYSAGPTMITARAEMGVATAGRRIYTVGGAIPAFGASSNANEALTP